MPETTPIASARPAPPQASRTPDPVSVPAGELVDVLYALALRITGGAREAGEVVEQTLIEPGPARFPISVAALASLTRRCRDLALVRSGKRAITSVRRRSGAFPGREGAPAGLDALRRDAARALESLDPADRRVIEMTTFEGFALADVAATLRSTAVVERARLRRALAALAPAGPPRLVIALGAPAAAPGPDLRARLIAVLGGRA